MKIAQQSPPVNLMQVQAAGGASQQKCWSAKKCSGKVLSNRDRHNCCNYGGKSWSDNQGNCFPC